MSLLADLCFKFHAHPEVLATDGLALLLNERALGTALGHFLSVHLQITGGLPLDLRFETQESSEEDGRPDIVGVTPDGQLSLVIEVKFWAALTDKQPVAYLEKLLRVASGQRALLFIAPASRHEVLWAELTNRLIASGRTMTNPGRPAQELRVAYVEGIPLALVSWRSVLATMSEAAAGGARTSDIDQLAALASRMDSDAFLPLRSDELSPRIGLRIFQLNEIVDEVLTILARDRVCTKCNKSGGAAYYGASILVRGHWLYFEISYWHWAHCAATPFWLVYSADQKGKGWRALDAALVPLTREVPPRLIRRRDVPPMMPLYIPTGVEKHHVVDALCKQIREIVDLLPEASRRRRAV